MLALDQVFNITKQTCTAPLEYSVLHLLLSAMGQSSKTEFIGQPY